MRKKGFTLVELLVVIAIIAMLLAILMPALNKVRQIAYRMVCGSNLSGLGKACLTYANDYQESYPVFGGTKTVWTSTAAITGGSFTWCVDIGASGLNMAEVTAAPTTASMFLLVKYADVSPGQYVCKATDAKKFDLTAVDAVTDPTKVKDVTQVWDFGPNPGSSKITRPYDFCSYAYQQPYRAASGGTSYVLSASAQAGMVVMADKGPWFDTKGALVAENTTAGAGNGPKLLTDADLGTSGMTQPGPVKKDEVKKGNSGNHQWEGQNVLYADSHVSFENSPTVGIEQDNIYTPWGNTAPTSLVQKMGGVKPSASASATASIPQNEADSFLVQ